MVWVYVAAVLGAAAVAAGAFGAHGLAERVEPRQLEALRTAAHYALLHSAAILALGLFEAATGRGVRLPAGLMSVGTVLFAGSIFALVLLGWRFLGPVTPIGGLALIAGWLSLFALLRS
ncbi:MAG: DUF423 domain-containing protein [Proteobacteria bacterium]|nr:DUF423 domain-containing protein [Pseudomonadota bacterium]